MSRLLCESLPRYVHDAISSTTSITSKLSVFRLSPLATTWELCVSRLLSLASKGRRSTKDDKEDLVPEMSVNHRWFS